MRVKWAVQLVTMGLLADPGIQACASTPATHVLVPSRETVPQMQKLSQQVGAVVSILTISGEEAVFTVAPGEPASLSGKRLDAGSSGQDAAYSFDLLALIYYTEPAAAKVPEQLRWPVKDRFPEPKGIGAADEGLACGDLDEELARNEALRWVARSNGALPYSAGEKFALHAKHTAIDVGVVFLVLAGGIGGFGGGDRGPKAGEWAVNEEAFRWAVSAIDERIDGLLKLKDQKSCAARVSLQVDSGDVQLWRSLDSQRGARAGASPDEHEWLAKRTAQFDLLGPKPVVRKLAFELPAGETAQQVVSNVNWFQGFNSLADFSSAMKGAQEYLEGAVVLTDRALEMQVKRQIGPSRASVAPSVISIAYKDIASAQVQHKHRDCVVIVRQNDGHVDSFRAIRGMHIDCEQVDAVGKILQQNVDAVRAAGATQ